MQELTLDGRIVEMSTLFPLDLVTIASGNNSLASLLWCSNALERLLGSNDKES